jgi:hypothetical protein
MSIHSIHTSFLRALFPSPSLATEVHTWAKLDQSQHLNLGQRKQLHNPSQDIQNLSLPCFKMELHRKNCILSVAELLGAQPTPPAAACPETENGLTGWDGRAKDKRKSWWHARIWFLSFLGSAWASAFPKFIFAGNKVSICLNKLVNSFPIVQRVLNLQPRVKF